MTACSEFRHIEIVISDFTSSILQLLFFSEELLRKKPLSAMQSKFQVIKMALKMSFKDKLIFQLALVLIARMGP